MHLLDTDTLTHFHAGNPNVIQRLRSLNDPIVGTTIIIKAELLRGRIDFILKANTADDFLRAQNLFTRTEELLIQIEIFPMTTATIERFEQLLNIRGLSKIGRADLLIASIALANRAVLVTRNLRHFRQIPRLQVVNWVD
ncbi:MAG: type II toxin-antitoxin system VapC family toxin [Oculatellaceae cyanobacterium Prado106]|jgi:tRNA(fMet)-specific endonuclease VapC|nr:type II toxin-antitoxin system VapC family toxin [Oculatellaceae cyanobacterium Prado106]